MKTGRDEAVGSVRKWSATKHRGHGVLLSYRHVWITQFNFTVFKNHVKFTIKAKRNPVQKSVFQNCKEYGQMSRGLEHLYVTWPLPLSIFSHGKEHRTWLPAAKWFHNKIVLNVTKNTRATQDFSKFGGGGHLANVKTFQRKIGAVIVIQWLGTAFIYMRKNYLLCKKWREYLLSRQSNQTPSLELLRYPITLHLDRKIALR